MLHGDYLPEYTKEDVYRWMKKSILLMEARRSRSLFSIIARREDTVAFKYGMSDTEHIDLPAMGLKAWLYGHWHVNHVHKHKVTGVYYLHLYACLWWY